MCGRFDCVESHGMRGAVRLNLKEGSIADIGQYEMTLQRSGIPFQGVGRRKHIRVE